MSKKMILPDIEEVKNNIKLYRDRKSIPHGITINDNFYDYNGSSSIIFYFDKNNDLDFSFSRLPGFIILSNLLGVDSTTIVNGKLLDVDSLSHDEQFQFSTVLTKEELFAMKLNFFLKTIK